MEDPFGTTMRWIVTLKDHFTKFILCGAVPQKKPAMVAHLVGQWFGMIGYPLIYHTDNGKEVNGFQREILQMIRDFTPDC